MRLSEVEAAAATGKAVSLSVGGESFLVSMREKDIYGRHGSFRMASR